MALTISEAVDEGLDAGDTHNELTNYQCHTDIQGSCPLYGLTCEGNGSCDRLTIFVMTDAVRSSHTHIISHHRLTCLTMVKGGRKASTTVALYMYLAHFLRVLGLAAFALLLI